MDREEVVMTDKVLEREEEMLDCIQGSVNIRERQDDFREGFFWSYRGKKGGWMAAKTSPF